MTYKRISFVLDLFVSGFFLKKKISFQIITFLNLRPLIFGLTPSARLLAIRLNPYL